MNPDTVHWWTPYQNAAIPLAWIAASLLVNLLLSIKTAEEWLEFGMRYPKTGLIINVLVRALGIDVASAIQRVQIFLNAQADRSREKLKEQRQASPSIPPATTVVVDTTLVDPKASEDVQDKEISR